MKKHYHTGLWPLTSAKLKGGKIFMLSNNYI